MNIKAGKANSTALKERTQITSVASCTKLHANILRLLTGLIETGLGILSIFKQCTTLYSIWYKTTQSYLTVFWNWVILTYPDGTCGRKLFNEGKSGVSDKSVK